MILLTPQEVEELKEINKKLQGLRLNGGPIDDIGPLNISIEEDSLEILEKIYDDNIQKKMEEVICELKI